MLEKILAEYQTAGIPTVPGGANTNSQTEAISFIHHIRQPPIPAMSSFAASGFANSLEEQGGSTVA